MRRILPTSTSHGVIHVTVRRRHSPEGVVTGRVSFSHFVERGLDMRKFFRVICILTVWAALTAAGVIAAEQPALAQQNFPLKHKLAQKGFFPGKMLPSAPLPAGLFPGKWKLEITEDVVPPKEPDIKKECPVPGILDKLRAPGPAIKMDIKKPEWCDPKAKNGKKNGKNGKDEKKNGEPEEEPDEDPSNEEGGWNVDRLWISPTQG